MSVPTGTATATTDTNTAGATNIFGVSPTSGQGDTAITYSADTRSLPEGDYTGKVLFTCPAAADTRTVLLSVSVQVQPSNIPGLVMWLDSRGGVLNSSGLPAAPGDAVASWTNKAPGTATATQATANNRGTLISDGGTKFVRLSSASHPQHLVLSGLTGLRSDAATVFLVVRAAGVNDLENVCALGVAGAQVALQTSGNGFYLLSSPTGGAGPTQPVSGAFDTLSYYADSSVTPAGTRGLFMAEGANTNHALINAANTPFTSYDASTSYLGATSAGTFTWNGDIQAMLIFNRILTDAEMLLMRQYLSTTYTGAALPPQTLDLKHFGDSISAGFATTAGTFLAHVQAAISNVEKSHIQNFAVPASTTDTCVASGVWAIGLAAPTTGTQVASIFYGANDLATSGNVSHFYNNLIARVADLRAAGTTKIGLCTVLPRSEPGLVTTFEADRQSANSLIRAYCAANADCVLIDFGADPVYGAFGASDDTALFGDKIHPTDHTHALMALTYTNAMFPVVADRLVFTRQAAVAYAGTAFGTQPVIAAQDAFGDTDPSFGGDVTIEKLTGPGDLSGSLTATAIAGVATFTDLQFSAVGPYTLKVTAAGLASSAGTPLTVAQVVVGTRTIEPTSDSVASGTAAAYKFTNAVTATATTASIFLDAIGGTSLILGLYSDNAGLPGTLLTHATIGSPTGGGTWNTVAVPPVALTAGTTYWLAFLELGGASAFIRTSYGAGATDPQSLLTGQSTLPATWTGTLSATTSPASIFLATA